MVCVGEPTLATPTQRVFSDKTKTKKKNTLIKSIYSFIIILLVIGVDSCLEAIAWTICEDASATVMNRGCS